jgi:hypothetical protein
VTRPIIIVQLESNKADLLLFSMTVSLLLLQEITQRESSYNPSDNISDLMVSTYITTAS